MSKGTETLFSSAVRTDSGSPHNSPTRYSNGKKGARFILDITASGGNSPTLDVKIQMQDHLGGAFVDVAGGAFAQKTGTGTSELVIYPGVAETSNVSVSDVVPQIYRAVATIGGVASPTFTFSLSAELYD